jgi:hypothetical protein
MEFGFKWAAGSVPINCDQMTSLEPDSVAAMSLRRLIMMVMEVSQGIFTYLFAGGGGRS